MFDFMYDVTGWYSLLTYKLLGPVPQLILFTYQQENFENSTISVKNKSLISSI